MNITQRSYNKFDAIKSSMENGTASNEEILDFLDFIINSGNEHSIFKYIKNIGFKSIDDYKLHLNNQIENQNTIKNLAIVGGAVLLAYFLLKK
jgi:hypothetical protein